MIQSARCEAAKKACAAYEEACKDTDRTPDATLVELCKNTLRLAKTSVIEALLLQGVEDGPAGVRSIKTQLASMVDAGTREEDVHPAIWARATAKL